MAAPSIGGIAATTAATTAAPAVLSMPSGIVAGELLMAFCAGDTAADMTESGSSVWTRLDNGAYGVAVQGAVFAKIAAGSDTLSVQFGANDFAAVVVRIQNHGVTDPATDIFKGTAAGGNTDSPDPPNCNPGVSAAYLWLEFFAADDDDEATTYWSTDFTGIGQRQSDASATSCLVAAAYQQLTASSLDPSVMHLSASSAEEWVAQTYAIPPGEVGGATYTVTYDGNTNDGGDVPVDASSPYTELSTVTVLGNTGSLTKTSYNFNGWNTAADGSGTGYAPSDTFSMPPANTTLYAVWASIGAGDYYVTNAGAGTRDGLSLVNAWSVGDFNGSSAPGAGDTVVFSGTISTLVVPPTNGASGNVLTLDFSAATLDVYQPATNQISFNNRSYITLAGGAIASRASAELIVFGSTPSHDIVIDGFTFTGPDNGTSLFVEGKSCYNLTISNNTLDNLRQMYWTDTTASHDITISDNYARTSTNETSQSDVVSWGDAYNITIEGNKFINRAPGSASNSRHNDVIQCYRSGATPNAPPYGVIIRYNWLEVNNVGSDGNSSITQLEGLNDTGGVAAAKIYSNVLVGRSGDGSNNGLSIYGMSAASHVYVYNNTFYSFGAFPQMSFRAYGSGTLHMYNNAGVYAVEPGTGIDVRLTTNDWDYNYLFNMPVSSGEGKMTDLGISLADVCGANGSVANPQYADVANDDFSPAVGSPLIAAGLELDAEYNVRLVPGATWPNPTTTASSAEIGAFSYTVGEAGDREVDVSTLNMVFSLNTPTVTATDASGQVPEHGWPASVVRKTIAFGFIGGRHHGH